MRPVAMIVGMSLVLSGCMEGGDPAQGGFAAGVAGIASGSYDDRIDAREAEVAAAEARNASLARQQQDLAAQIGRAEQTLARERANLSRLRQSASGLDPATQARVNEVLTRTPSSASDSARLADLQRTISDARQLAAELSRL